MYMYMYMHKHVINNNINFIIKHTCTCTCMLVCTLVYTTIEYSLPASKMIATGMKSKTLHKEELTMSETEKRVRRNIEEHAKLHQKKKTIQQQQQQHSHGQPTRARKDNKVLHLSLSPPPLSLSILFRFSLYFSLSSPFSSSLSCTTYYITLSQLVSFLGY